MKLGIGLAACPVEESEEGMSPEETIVAAKSLLFNAPFGENVSSGEFVAI
jgi:hypothetical protein